MGKSVIVVVILLLSMGIYYLGFSIDQPYEGSYYKVQKALESENRIKAITLGNSHAGSIDWNELGLSDSGYSLHGGFFDIFEMYYVAEYVVPRMESLEYVFISVPYYFFQFDNGAIEDEYQNSFRQRTYFMVPKLKLINNDLENYIKAWIAPIIRPDHWEGVLAPPILDLLNGVVIRRPNGVKEVVTSQYLLKHSKTRTKQNEQQVQKMCKAHKNLAKDAQQRFSDLIKLLKRHDIKPVLFRPSYHRNYNQRFDSSIVKKNENLLNEVLNKYNVQFFDFNKIRSFTSNDSLYRDSDHYNTYGDSLFSNTLADSLGFGQ